MASRHTFVALNLMSYRTFSVSTVVFQLFLNKNYIKMGAWFESGWHTCPLLCSSVPVLILQLILSMVPIIPSYCCIHIILILVRLFMVMILPRHR